MEAGLLSGNLPTVYPPGYRLPSYAAAGQLAPQSRAGTAATLIMLAVISASLVSDGDHLHALVCFTYRYVGLDYLCVVYAFLGRSARPPRGTRPRASFRDWCRHDGRAPACPRYLREDLFVRRLMLSDGELFSCCWANKLRRIGFLTVMPDAQDFLMVIDFF